MKKKNVEACIMISVIVPTYNRPAMLIEAINSILNQTYQDFEIIVVNDAGMDVERKIKSFNKNHNIKYLMHNENKGLAAARNTGIKEARGKYIAYLDDDDVYYPDHLETLVNFLKDGEYKVAYTDTYRVHQKKEKGKYLNLKKDLLYSCDFNYDRILIENFIPILCLMHEKSCLDEVGYFDENLNALEDWDLLIRISRKFKFFHINKITSEVSWRTDATTMTSERPLDFYKARKMIYEKYKNYAETNPQILNSQKEKLAHMLAKTINILEEIYSSRTWKVGRFATSPWRWGRHIAERIAFFFRSNR
jgi:glycosyltransferase involved in cell wall biosynthesis